MRIAIDINHPSDVHFFKNFIRLAKEKGHEILIIASRKDVSLDLLDYYGFDYVNLGSYGESIAAKLINIPIMDMKVLKSVWKFQPHVFVGFASVRAAHASFFLRNTQSYIFDDTEHSFARHLYLPFAAHICVPDCFTGKKRKNQLFYKGYKELAYLHPKYFTPDIKILDKLGLKREDKFFVVRFVAWKAAHDFGYKGFSLAEKKTLIQTLEKYGRVFVCSEDTMPAEFKNYKPSIHPAELHDLLAFSSMYVGEGATMASEAALLGIPAIYVNPLPLGYITDEEKYGGLFHISDREKAIKKAEFIAAGPAHNQAFQMIRQSILESKIDVTAWILDIVLDKYSPKKRK